MAIAAADKAAKRKGGSMSKQRIGLIGLGMAVAPHAASLKDLADRVDVLAYSPSVARRDAFKARFALPVTDRLEAVIEDPAIDAVILLTPPDARLELVARIARAGKPVLMEKPLERSLAAAEEVVRLTETAGVTAGVVFQHRFREAALALAQRLAAGDLGQLATVHLEVPWWRPQAYYDEPGRGTLARDGGGVLITQAIHSLDLMLSLTGPAASVQAITGTSALHRMETEDFVGAGLAFANGAMGGLMATTSFYPGMTEKLIIAGTEATAVLEGGRLQLHRHDGTAETVGEAGGTGGGADPMAFTHAWHKAVITDFLDAVDQGKKPRVSARDALHVHRLIDALLRSAAEGRRVTIG
jgi:UDP-N-acetyl-2-amino-2-deoxyglucuronate dehydrogenase